MEAILLNQLKSRLSLIQDVIRRGREFMQRDTNTEDDLLKLKIEFKLELGNFDKAINFYMDRGTEHSAELVNACMDSQREAERVQLELETMSQLFKIDNRSTTSKLPRLDLVRFDGDILCFSEFWDRFSATVHNKEISNAEKLSYLLNSVEGGAREALQGLKATNDNYQIALDVLTKRYGSKELLIDAHYEALIKIKKASHSANDCRCTHNQLEKHLRILESLGEDINNNHLRVVITSKFPDNVIYQLNLQTPVERDVKTLRESLNNIITALERVDNDKSSSTLQDIITEAPKAVVSTEALHIRTSKRPHQDNPRQKNKRACMECAFCHETHYSDTCKKFSTLWDRQQRLRGKCFSCFRLGHRIENCRVKSKCYFCKNNTHNTALCPKKFKPRKEVEKQLKAIAGNEFFHVEPSVENINVNNNQVRSFLQTATARLRNNDIESSCRILLDSGSQRSYITTRTATKLNIDPDSEDKLLIYTFGSNTPQETTSPAVDIIIETKRGLQRKIRVNIVPHITDCIAVMNLDNNETVDILADDDSLGERIDMLVGNDYYYSFMRNEHLKIGENLFLVNTEFGWVVSGNTDPYEKSNVLTVVTYCQCHESSCPYFAEPDLPLRNVDMRFLWALESIGISDSPKTTREEESVKFFNKTTKYEGGRYYVKWPWVQYPPDLPTNFGLAYRRLKSLLQRSNEETLKEYNQILREQQEANIIEVVEQKVNPIHQSNPPIHYLPHHIVQQEGKRGRIVYDASAKLKDQKSLNECLYRGPSMLEDLIGLILRFRTNKIGLTADVEKAFLQVGLQQEDKDVTRFLWLKDIGKGLSDDNLLHLRFCRVPFGIISSPFLLTATIRNHIALTNEDLMNNVADRCYMDNLLTGATSLNEATELFWNTQRVFNDLSMNIREWMSNDGELMNIIPEALKSKQSEKCKVLGLIWNVKKDHLELKLSEEIFEEQNMENNNTKKKVLRTLARVFDPHGFAAPLVLPMKMLFQELCVLKLKWDKILPDDLLQKWKAIIRKLKGAKEIQIPRYTGHGNSGLGIKYELHTFTDASKNAYAAVTYLRVIGQKEITTAFLMSKARITPIEDKNELKIPRLELLAFLIGSRLVKYVKDNLDLPIDNQYIWTDSRVVLSWLNTSKLLPPFVSRRVNEIKQHKDVEFCYINTNENPADLATRPELWEQKKGLWFAGPAFLTQEIQHWPTNRHVDDHQTSLFVGETLDMIDGPEMTMKGYEKESPNYLVLEEEKDCQEEEQIKESLKNIRNLQRQHFPDEVSGKRTSLARNLNLFTDIDGVLRCKGRMSHTDWSYDSKYPMLIPRDSSFTSDIIRRAHEKNYHVGVSHTLSLIRQKYWIPQGKAQVQKILKRCPQCVKHGGGPYKLPAPPALPAERVNYSRPFTYSGLDYFGPVFVDSDSGKSKRWVCLFTCLAIRAIHLEIVRDLTAEECLLALRRFTASRGNPKKMVSDNGLYFKLTSEVLTAPYCTENQIEWKFIPQLAPWHGGFYERLIGLVKNCLKRTLGKHLLGDSQLATVMKEVEAVINTRPLTSVGADLEYVLKPADFLSAGKCLEISPADNPTGAEGTTTKVDLVEGWKRGQTILNEFKRMFQHQYLQNLREKHRYSLKQPRIMANKAPLIGDIVQLKDDSKNRVNWKVGKIISLIEGPDGQCRVAKVKTGSTELTRSIGHLYPLEIEDSQNTVETDKNINSTVQEPSNEDNIDTQSVIPGMDIFEDQRDRDQANHMSMRPEVVVEQTQNSPEECVDIISSEIDNNTNDVDPLPGEIEMLDVSTLDTDQIPITSTRPVRDAALRAKEKITEWTRQLVAVLQTPAPFGSVAEFDELHD